MSLDDVKLMDLQSGSVGELPSSFEKSEMLWINALNSSNTGGQIIFDTSGTGAIQNYVDWSSNSTYLMIPYQVTLQNNLATNTVNASMVAIKGCSMSIIDRLNVVLGSSVSATQNSQYNGVMSTWMLQEHLSLDKRATFDPSVLFCPDTATSYQLTAAGAPGTNMTSYKNNIVDRIGPPAVTLFGANAILATGESPNNSNQNVGMLKRAKWMVNPGSIISDVVANYPQGVVVVGMAAAADSLYLNNTDAVAGALINSQLHWNCYLYCPLKFVHPLFSALGITKGLRVYLQVNLNTASAATFNATANQEATYCNATVQYGSNACFMLSNFATNTSATYGEINAVSYGPRAGYTPRLYYNAVTLKAEDEARMRFPLTRTVKYLDWQVFVQPSVGQQLNFLVSNSIQSLRRIYVLPMISNGAAGAAGVSVQNSLLCPEPYCASPCRFINMQVLIGNKQLFPNTIQYPYEEWAEAQQRFLCNANEDNVIASGSSSFYDFGQNNNPLCFDIASSPYASLSDTSPVSVQLIANVQTGTGYQYNIDVYCFLVYEKTLQLSQDTGDCKVVSA
jgi:hypothetical protein